MWRCEDVKMRRCEDEKMWCEDEKMWRCENVWQTLTVRRTLRWDALGENAKTDEQCDTWQVAMGNGDWTYRITLARGNAFHCHEHVFARANSACQVTTWPKIGVPQPRIRPVQWLVINMVWDLDVSISPMCNKWHDELLWVPFGPLSIVGAFKPGGWPQLTNFFHQCWNQTSVIQRYSILICICHDRFTQVVQPPTFL